MEQPGSQDSGSVADQPGSNTIADDLVLDPADPNPGDPDPDLIEPEEEDEEIEVGGRKFALPKSAAETLKAERLMQADYTRKTQEVAESRKAIEAEREQVRQHAQQQQQHIKDIAKVHALDDEIAKFKDVDWDTLSDQDPVTVQKLQIRLQTLQTERQTAAAAVAQKQDDHALAEQQDLAKQVQEAEAYVQREIKGWGEERATKLTAFAMSEGLNLKADGALAKVFVKYPALFKLAHKAEMFDQLEKKQSTKPPAPAAPPAPVTRVGAVRASAKVDPSKMTDAQWYAAEQERRRKR